MAATARDGGTQKIHMLLPQEVPEAERCFYPRRSLQAPSLPVSDAVLRALLLQLFILGRAAIAPEYDHFRPLAACAHKGTYCIDHRASSQDRCFLRATANSVYFSEGFTPSTDSHDSGIAIGDVSSRLRFTRVLEVLSQLRRSCHRGDRAVVRHSSLLFRRIQMRFLSIDRTR